MAIAIVFIAAVSFSKREGPLSCYGFEPHNCHEIGYGYADENSTGDAYTLEIYYIPYGIWIPVDQTLHVGLNIDKTCLQVVNDLINSQPPNWGPSRCTEQTFIFSL